MQQGKFRHKDSSIDFETFQKNLKTLMQSRGLTMKALSIELNMNTTSISRYFIDRNPDLTSIWRIANYFDVSIDWLLGRSTSRYDSIPEPSKRVADLYTSASDSDKLVVDTLLSKYAK